MEISSIYCPKRTSGPSIRRITPAYSPSGVTSEMTWQMSSYGTPGSLFGRLKTDVLTTAQATRRPSLQEGMYSAFIAKVADVVSHDKYGHRLCIALPGSSVRVGTGILYCCLHGSRGWRKGALTWSILSLRIQPLKSIPGSVSMQMVLYRFSICGS